MKKSNAAAAGETNTIIRAELAGQWYPDRPDALRRELGAYLDAAKASALPDVIALIAPHAGYRASGAVAAYSYKQLAGRAFNRVIVMGPTHHVYLRNTVAFPSEAASETPLGRVPLDREFIRGLEASPLFRPVPGIFDGENSIEMQIPMLQMTLTPGTPIVPLAVGQLDLPTAQAVADELRRHLDTGTLVIASTDFTHYGPNYQYVPFSTQIAANLKQLDMGAVALIEKKDPAGFIKYCRDTGATICGHDPLVVLLALLPATAQPHLLQYDTSGRIFGDMANSVSYVSLAFTGAWAEPRRDPTPELSADDRKALLQLARKTLEFYFRTRRQPAPEDVGVAITPGMQQVMGAFVTLHEDGELRGCIGEIFPTRPLYEAVIERALDAALHDPRFMPVRAEELPQLEIEISALTPPHPVASYRDIVLGRHGMVLRKQGRSAVFLPQVAPEQGWDLPTTLSHLAMKAGLPAEAWQEGAEYTVFEAIVFGEHERRK